MKIHMVLIVRYSGILICKVAPRNFSIVFKELRGLGGFGALDRLGFERRFDAGVRTGVIADAGARV
jgi:hypothetical protein